MMSNERWERVKQIYNSALACELNEREDFLREACGGDESLRKEVEVLLSHQGKLSGFMKAPAMEVAAQVLAKGSGEEDIENMVGRSVAHYGISEKIGEGGMGIVYKAHDTRLNRSVAIKALPDIFAADPERLARFEREAKVLASLNHPNIASVYGLEKSDGKSFLIMELVEGRTLADRLKKGRIRLDESLEICRQIAEGIEAAHEKGILHRDLKPANIQITSNGRVKILDFGLARAFEKKGSVPDQGDTPTITHEMTRTGVILGTAAYMSPEQAKGAAVDRRADIWALGCILFECLTGKSPFDGATATETLAAVLKEDPDWQALPLETPVCVHRLLRRCLQKDPSLRFHDIADARLDIVEAQNSSPSSGVVSIQRPARKLIMGIGGLIVGVVLTALFVWTLRQPTTTPAVVRTTIELPPNTQLTGRRNRYPVRTEFSLSPDGKYLVFSAIGNGTEAPSMLYLRALDGSDPEPIKGTEGAMQPFFSPDGNWIGFSANGKLRKVPRSGGIPKDLLACTNEPYGAFWSESGRIFWGERSEGIKWIPAEGGDANVLTRVNQDRETQHTLPFLLPGGKAVLFTVMPDDFGNRAHIEAASIPDGTRKMLIDDAADARYLATGHVVFLRQGLLMAAPFDPSRMELTGPAVPMIEDVEQALNIGGVVSHSGAGQFSVSASGSLVYASGGTRHFLEYELAWVSRDGRVEVLPGFDRLDVANQMRFSPDNRLLAFVQQLGPLWLFDLERATFTRASPEGIAASPCWSADGHRLTFCWSAAGRLKKWQVSIGEGSDRLEPLAIEGHNQWLSSWSRDGKFLALTQVNNDTRSDILIYETQDRKLVPFLNSRSNEQYPEFSPDGLWLAYSSDETGRDEVYLRSFPDGSHKITVSSLGGNQPCWSPDGRELFYVSLAPSKMVKVDISLGSNPSVGRSEALFDFQYVAMNPIRGWDLDRYGRRFLFARNKPMPDVQITRLRLVQNWFEELKRLVPAGMK